MGTGIFGGEGFIMEKLEGDGMAFVHAGGYVLEKELRPGEILKVDTGCVVAIQAKLISILNLYVALRTGCLAVKVCFLQPFAARESMDTIITHQPPCWQNVAIRNVSSQRRRKYFGRIREICLMEGYE